jgi:hypothetical protein
MGNIGYVLAKLLDNMKQLAAILVLLVSYQNLPVSAILVQIYTGKY